MCSGRGLCLWRGKSAEGGKSRPWPWSLNLPLSLMVFFLSKTLFRCLWCHSNDAKFYQSSDLLSVCLLSPAVSYYFENKLQASTLGFPVTFSYLQCWGTVLAGWTGQEEVRPSFSGFLSYLSFPRLLLLLSPCTQGRSPPPPSLGSPLVSQGWVFIQVLKASGPVGWTWTPSSLESFPLSLPRWKGKWGTTSTLSGAETFTLSHKQVASRESDENQKRPESFVNLLQWSFSSKCSDGDREF